jgi:hypothetical protein
MIIDMTYNVKYFKTIRIYSELINSMDIDRVKQDVIRFIANPQDLAIGSREYFLQICESLETN